MPTKIPNVTRIARDVPNLERQVITGGGDSFNILGAGVSALGQGLRQRDLLDRQDSIDDADLNLAIGFEKEANAYDQDPDFDTIGERSDASMSEALGTLASGITNADDRASFVTRGKLSMERVRSKLGRVAWGKKRDHHRGVIDTQLVHSREAALTGDVGAVSTLVKRRLDSAVAQDYYSSEEAAEMYQKWQTSTAIGKLEMEAPGDRLEMLKAPWAKNLPSDTRAKYKRQAEKEVMLGKAQSTVDTMMAKPDVTLDGGMADIERKIKDPKLRAATEARFKDVFATQEAATIDQQNELYDKYSLDVMEGGKVDMIPGGDWARMSTSMRVNLKNLEGKPRNASNPQALVRAVTLSEQGRWGDLKQFISTNSSLLSTGDIEQYTKAAEQGLAPAGVSDKQLIDGIIPGTDTSDKELRSQMLLTINTWRNNFVRNYAKEPTPEQTESQVKRLMMDHDRHPDDWWRPFTTTPIHELEGQERDEALHAVHLTELRDKDLENFTLTQQYLDAQGQNNVDRFEFEEAYNNQRVVTSIRRRDITGYNDVAGHFQTKGMQPTHKQFIDVYSAMRRVRSGP